MDDSSALLSELERLARRLPIPDPTWHTYVAEMQDVKTDMLAAIAAVRLHPPAREELARRVNGEADPPDADSGGPELRAAALRLRRLPLPAGQHPFLDEIVPTLEGAEALLAALASEAGAAAFAAARPSRP